MADWRVCPNPDPGGQCGNWHVIRTAGDLPFILSTASMSARGRDDVAAICFDIEARAEYTGPTTDGLSEVPEKIMGPAAGETDRRLGELAVLSFELIKGQITTISWILIKDNKATARTRRDRDIGIWMICPPLIDLPRIRGGILKAMPRQRVFPWVGTIRFTTSTALILHPMAGKDRPAPRGIRQGRGTQEIVRKVWGESVTHVAPKRCGRADAAPWHGDLPGASPRGG